MAFKWRKQYEMEKNAATEKRHRIYLRDLLRLDCHLSIIVLSGLTDVQGLLMCAVDLGAITLLADHLGMPFDVALAVVILNGLLYLAHHLLGDPVIPGWITPAVPLLVLFVGNFRRGLIGSMHSLRFN
ncbi:hypothetical protein RCO48_35430 [Peribacillus frigoritolerans]|nr:hypothetical protein [Peribacillus frigoritolerans]